MTTAIIGHTGFVGSNLIRQKKFDYFFNTQNIEAIQGQRFELVVCAGMPGAKWLANKEPDKDKYNLERVINCLKQISAEKIVLISTVDVYHNPVGVDEKTEINLLNLHPYGKHRRQLEIFIQDNFASLIVRLPGLFGEGLKKNVIYDFLHNNLVDKIHCGSIFQFYYLEDLWGDLEIALANNLNVVNFATEPLKVSELTKEVFDMEFTNKPDINVPRYDMRTLHDQKWTGSQLGYIYSKHQIIKKMRKFIEFYKIADKIRP